MMDRSIGVMFLLCGTALLGCSETTASEAGDARAAAVDMAAAPAQSLLPAGSWSVTGSQFTYLIDIAGSGPSDVWAVGNQGLIMRFDGTAWRQERLPATERLFSVWVARPGDAWIASTRICASSCGSVTGSCMTCGVLWHFNGTRYEEVATQADRYFQGIWGSSASDLWIAGSTTAPTTGRAWRFDGSKLTEMAVPAGDYLFDVSGSAADDVWMVGKTFAGPGAVLRFDGTSLQSVAAPATGDLYTVHAVSRSDVWLGGNELLHWNGTLWSTISPPAALGVIPQNLYRIFVAGPNDLWAVGGADRMLAGGAFTVGKTGGGTFHFDGTGWTSTALKENDTPMTNFGLWGARSDDIWAAGMSRFHYSRP